jgi:hypothetical protein
MDRHDFSFNGKYLRRKDYSTSGAATARHMEKRLAMYSARDCISTGRPDPPAQMM